VNEIRRAAGRNSKEFRYDFNVAESARPSEVEELGFRL
jgi:hypothetical protein